MEFKMIAIIAFICATLSGIGIKIFPKWRNRNKNNGHYPHYPFPLCTPIEARECYAKYGQEASCNKCRLLRKNIVKASSKRGYEWVAFSSQVLDHIEQYTIPQWGDKPNDQLHTEWTINDCMLAIKKYANRAGKNSRGPDEDLRDLLKIAHYACVAWHKRQEL